MDKPIIIVDTRIEESRAYAFWKKINLFGPNECMEWIGAKNKFGYGYFWDKRVHRLMWEMSNGPIPKGLVIMHLCDNRACINIYHLRLGTIEENNKDMASKNRSSFGEKNGKAKLTNAQVAKIKSLLPTMGNKTIATMYGVNHSTISKIRRGHHWGKIINGQTDYYSR